MEGEDACFWLFLLIWKDKSFAYIPLKRKGSKSCSSPQKFLLVSWVIFNNFEKKVLRRGFRGLKA